MDRMNEAQKFAIQSHGDQKYGEHPYEVHLQHVYRVLEQEGYAENEILAMAVWLHDVVEDTHVTINEIESKFGFEVRNIVERVTDEQGESRRERKLKTYPKIKGHDGATIVKLCDRIANVEASKFVPHKLNMYFSEYAEFKYHLFVPGISNILWKRLDSLLLVSDKN